MYRQRPAKQVLFFSLPAVLLLFVVFLVSEADGAVFHVDASLGNDADDGSLAHPWKSIARVNASTFSPGDQVLFKRGGEWHEMLLIPSSGTKKKPLTFGAYGEGAPPVIDGSASVDGEWFSLGNHIYAISRQSKPGLLFYQGIAKPSIATLTFSPATARMPAPGSILLQDRPGIYTNAWVVSVDEALKIVSILTPFEDRWDTTRKVLVRQFNPATKKEEQWQPIAPPTDITPQQISLTRPGHWFWKSGMLYLNSDVLPKQAEIKAGSLPFGIHTNGRQHLLIRDIAIRGTNSAGLLLSGTDDSVVEKVRIESTGNQGLRGALVLHNSSNNLITANTIESVLVTGIAVYADKTQSRGNIISRNHISKTGSAGILIGGEEGFRITDNKVIDNEIDQANQLAYDSAGIYTYFCGKGNELRNNRVRNGGSMELKSAGIMVDTDSGPITIVNNLLENNSHGGIMVTESGHTILNNRLINNNLSRFHSAEIVFFPVNDDVSGCVVKNNFIQTAKDATLFQVFKGSDRGHVIDANEYHGGSRKPFCWKEKCFDFPGWQQESSQDSHSAYLP